MRALTLAALLVACSAVAPSPSGSPAFEPPAGPCGVALRPLATARATVTLLPHRIGDLLAFGLGGAFASSASSYPPGAQTHWWDLTADGATTRQFEWPIEGRLSQSPDGARLVYRAVDPATGDPGLYVRDRAGTARPLASGLWSPRSWPDATHVYVTADDSPGPVWSLDTTTGARPLVFDPPRPPQPTQYFDDEWFLLSGDAKWAVLLRDNDDDTVIETHLYDVSAGAFIAAPLPVADVSLSPRGDVMAWIEGRTLRAMHLCDRTPVTLIGLGTFAPPYIGGIHWSPDGRWLTISSGVTDEANGPRAVVVADLQRATAAVLDRPWGFISGWSPDARFVVLSRGGLHGDNDRLARLAFP